MAPWRTGTQTLLAHWAGARAQRRMTWPAERTRLAWLGTGEGVRGEGWGRRLEKAAAVARSCRPHRPWEGEDVLFAKHGGALEGK